MFNFQLFYSLVMRKKVMNKLLMVVFLFAQSAYGFDLNRDQQNNTNLIKSSIPNGSPANKVVKIMEDNMFSCLPLQKKNFSITKGGKPIGSLGELNHIKCESISENNKVKWVAFLLFDSENKLAEITVSSSEIN